MMKSLSLKAEEYAEGYVRSSVNKLSSSSLSNSESLAKTSIPSFKSFRG